MKIKFDVTTQELAIIQQVLQNSLPEQCKVWVFGSRAKNQAKYNSDLDLAIECNEALTKKSLMLLETGFDESPLPYRVDIVDLQTVEPYFKEIIEKQKVKFHLVKNIPALRFDGFSDIWENGNLSCLINSLDAGVSVNSADISALPNEKGILKTSCVTSGTFDPSENKLVNELDELKRLKEPVRKDTIIISRMNTASLVGANSLVHKDYPNLFLPDRLWAAKINQSHDPHWVGILTSTPFVRSYFSSRATGTSGSMKNITKADVLTVPIKYPTKPEQQKIATFLASVDEKLNKIRRKHELFETYKRGLMQKIFSQEIRFKQDDGSDFPDWKEKKLNEVLEPISREVNKPSSNYLAIGVRSHMKGTFQKPNSDPNKIAMDKLYVVESGDLIVNITFAWEGAIAIVKPQDNKGLVSHRFPTYLFKKDLLDNYFQYVICSTRFKFMLDLISPGGAGRNRVLSKKDFLNINWVFPSIEEQEEIAKVLNALDQKLGAVSDSISKLESFKKALLQKMFV